MFTTVNCLRIVQRLTKGKPIAIMMLMQIKAYVRV
jgi:hypothetical protein